MSAQGNSGRRVSPRRVIALVVSSMVVLASGVASAGITSHPTTIVYSGGSESGTFAVYNGYLSSPKPKCLADRTLKITIQRPDGSTKVLDLDRTSTNGAWRGGGDIAEANSAKATVARKVYGPRRHRQVCRASSLPLPVQFS